MKKLVTNIRQRFNRDEFMRSEWGFLYSTSEIYKTFTERYNKDESDKEKNEPYFRLLGAILLETGLTEKFKELIENSKEEKANNLINELFDYIKGNSNEIPEDLKEDLKEEVVKEIKESVNELKLKDNSGRLCLVCYIMFDPLNCFLKLLIKRREELDKSGKTHELAVPKIGDLELIDIAKKILENLCDETFAKNFALYSDTIKLLEEIMKNVSIIYHSRGFEFKEEKICYADEIRRNVLFYSYPEKSRSK